MELLLTSGKVVKYSKEDHEKISKHNWHDKLNGYCHSKIDNHMVLMHRFILNPPKGTIVDHINGDGYDNRRCNLRITNLQGNSENRKVKDGKLRGVRHKPKKDCFQSYIGYKKKRIYLGSFKTAELAAEAYDLFVVNIGHSLFNLNYPDKMDKYLKTPYIIPSLKLPKQDINLDKSFYQEIPLDASKVRLIIPSDLNSNVIIDKSDFINIKHLQFYITHNGYVATSSGMLHRILLDIKDPLIFVDHIDCNKLNNSRSNLRLSDSEKNSQNRKKMTKISTSKYIGVSFEKKRRKWRATLCVKGVHIFVGRYESEYDAALNRDKYIIQNYPESHYTLNILNH